MIELQATTGIPAGVDPATAELELADDFVAEEVAVRTLQPARDVYRDPPEHAPPLYHMLNGITPRARPEPGSALRLELTALRSGAVGPEWVKTIGHVHDTAPDGLGYPEAYEVVAGTATFLLFRPDDADRVLCVLVDGGTGERFVIPPGWHHLAINSGEHAMVFADVVARAVVPDYSLVRARRGGPFYLGPTGLERNPRFGSGSLVRLGCSDLPFPDSHGRLADAYLGDRTTLDYLLRPARYADLWSEYEAALERAPRQPVDCYPLAP